MKPSLLLPATLLSLTGSTFAQESLKQPRAGIIGLDTFHVPAFTKLFVKGKPEFGAMVYDSKGNLQGAKVISYEALCRQIGKFFRTGEPPVSEAETIEIFTFTEAADESLRQGGKPVALADVLVKAKAEAGKLAK